MPVSLVPCSLASLANTLHKPAPGAVAVTRLYESRGSEWITGRLRRQVLSSRFRLSDYFGLWVHNEVILTTQVHAGFELNRPRLNVSQP